MPFTRMTGLASRRISGARWRIEEPLRHEFRLLSPDGSIRWVESRGEPRTVSGKQVITGLLLDITARKQAEIALRESEERLKFALEAAGAGTWQVALETGEFIASDRMLALHGLPPGTPMTHEKALANVHPDDQRCVEETLRRTLETGEPFRVETRLLLADGSIRWLEIAWRTAIRFWKAGDRRTGARHHGAQEERGGGAGKPRKIGSRLGQHGRCSLHYRHGRLLRSFQRSLRSITTGSRTKKIAAKTLAEYPRFSMFSCRAASWRRWSSGPFRERFAAKRPLQAEYTIKRKDTGETWVGSYNFAPIRDDNGEITGAVVTARDITRAKAGRENRLRESEARLSSIIDTAADSIIVIDEKGTIQSANPATASDIRLQPGRT